MDCIMFNPFFTSFWLQFAADLVHVGTVFYVIYHLAKKGTKDVSFGTQLMWMLVFNTRYLDLFSGQYYTVYNTMLKFFFIITSIFVVRFIRYLEAREYARNPLSLEDFKDTYNLGRILYPAFIAALLFNYAGSFLCVLFSRDFSCLGPMDALRAQTILVEICWSFSRFVEPFLLLPQIHMGPSKFTFRYSAMLGAYVGLYLGKNIVGFAFIGMWDPITVWTRVIQLAICVRGMWVGSKPVAQRITLDAPLPEELQISDEKAPLIMD